MEKRPASSDVRKQTRKRSSRPTNRTEGASQSSSAGSSLASSRVSTPSISLSNATSSSTAASCSNNTSAVLNTSDGRQKYHYSREELMKLRESQLAKIKPKALNTKHEVSEDGLWDPDLWLTSFAASGESQTALPREKRKAVTDVAEGVARKRPTDNGTSKQGADNTAGDDEHIILGPQRGSFGTGCQVKKSTTTADPVSKRDSRERKEIPRIGSGRIQITERESRLGDGRISQDRDEPKSVFDRRRDSEDTRTRFTRTTEDTFSGRYGREDAYRTTNYDRDARRDDKGRYERDRERDLNGDRVFERRKDGVLKGKPEYPDKREYDDRRIGTKSSGRYSGRDGYQDHMSGGYGRSQAEPEWFTDGPKNQSDTIELGGFETINKRERLSPSIESEESSNRSGGRNLRDSGSTDSATKKIALGRKVEESEGKGKPAKPRSDSNKASERTTKTAADVELQNKGKLNAKDSAQPDKNGVPQRSGDPSAENGEPSTNEFDFNMFLNDNIWLNPAPTEIVNAGGSRFQQWFSADEGHSSPRPDGAFRGSNEAAAMFSLFGRGPSPSHPSDSNSLGLLDVLKVSENKPQELPTIYHRLTSRDSPQCPVNVAANVKALMDSVQPSAGQPVLPSGGKIMKAEDLEATLLSPKKKEHPSATLTSPPGGQNRQHHHQRSQEAPQLPSPLNLGPTHANKPVGPPPSMPSGARITTLEELEAGLRDIQVAPSGSVPVPKSDNQPDMSAFQKLLGLVNRDEVNTETTSSSANSLPTRAVDVGQQQVSSRQVFAMPENWMQGPGAPDGNTLFEFGATSKPGNQSSQQQQLSAQPRLPPQPQSVPLQQLFNQPPPQSMHSVPLQMMGFARPPGVVVSGNHPVNPMLHNPMMQHMQSMSPQVFPSQLSPPTSSPIMFGTQPPHNITAPMPIHSSQRMPTNTSQFPHNVNQQPLSQDALQLAYLQTLLKQFEEHRQMTGLPQTLAADSRPGAQQFGSSGTHGNQPSIAAINAAKVNSLSSIPTAVIRKMASMKADEKHAKEGDRPPSSRNSGVIGDANVPHGIIPRPAPDASNKGVGLAASGGPIAPGYGGGLPEPVASIPGYYQPGMSSAVSDANLEHLRNGRRLVGQGAMYQGMTTTGMELIHHQQQQQQLHHQQQLQQQQHTMRVSSSVLNQSTGGSGRPIVKGQPFGFVPGAAPRTNGSLTADQMQVLQPRNNNAHLMMQQQQPRQTVGPDAGTLPPQFTQQYQQQQQQMVSAFLKQLQKAPSSQGANFVAPSGVQPRPVMNQISGGDAIARWFGPDAFENLRLPNMPGQRVMTVDEIECTASPPAN